MVVALSILLLPLGMMRLALALGRDPRLGLLGFALAWDNNMLWGFVAYRLGLGLALLTLASFARARSIGDALRAAPWSIATALTHAQAFAILGVLALAVVGRPASLRRRPVLWLASLAPGVLILLPWVVDRALDAGGGSAPADWLNLHSLDQQLGGMLGFSTGMLPGPVGPIAGRLAFIFLSTAPLVLGLLALRRTRTALAASLALAGGLGWWLIVHEDGRFASGALVLTGLLSSLLVAALARGDDDRFAAAGLVFVSAALYFGLPMGVQWPIEQWYIYPRHATVYLAVCALAPPLVLEPAQALEGDRAGSVIAREGARGLRALALLPGLASAALLGAVAANRFADFGERAAPFRAIIEATGEEPRLLTLTLHDGDPAVPYHPFNQFHSYVVAERGGYDPLLYDNPSHPFVHTKKLPHPPWNQMGRFRLEEHGRYYDHILVQGADVIRGRRPPPGKRLEERARAGRWILYRLVETSTTGSEASGRAGSR